MKDIAKRAGISYTGLLHHFPRKRGSAPGGAGVPQRAEHPPDGGRRRP
ncbi:TetR family transcriptional regulator [Actinomadura adrarensis]|uniref:TetR family transcriptional regulator n=1 Tax=Actinomadura adrarensis TaxID=1819600 RepID=A0ABW3CGA7_9ACTN